MPGTAAAEVEADFVEEVVIDGDADGDSGFQSPCEVDLVVLVQFLCHYEKGCWELKLEGEES
jgi:hypothetical protein